MRRVSATSQVEANYGRESIVTIDIRRNDPSVIAPYAGCECDEIQGYLYSRPLPHAEFIDFIRGPRAF